MWAIILFLLVCIAVVLIVVLATQDTTSPTKSSKTLKSLYGECSTNFDCALGFHCELRDQPSKGVCVIPPGGSCHSAKSNLKDVSCYSGYYCDSQEGVCLKNN
jgi:hypothetical protein